MIYDRTYFIRLLDELDEFASAEFQERVWRLGRGPEVSSYEEVMCRLFDDLDFDRLVDGDWRRAGLSARTAADLATFRAVLRACDKDIPEIPHPADVLNHASWPAVRAAAARAAEAVRRDVDGHRP